MGIAHRLWTNIASLPGHTQAILAGELDTSVDNKRRHRRPVTSPGAMQRSPDCGDNETSSMEKKNKTNRKRPGPELRCTGVKRILQQTPRFRSQQTLDAT
ncbi:hypothetical protein RRG08_020418 [Elysia crispata]|uniref:Uncharacterized protein n=1 Tax=Elysia crispata TaxID=231223 RepID=A0AAE1B529_9GAST|nr:hypothetical protein RRG08_020418 [Elysia crispata]